MMLLFLIYKEFNWKEKMLVSKSIRIKIKMNRKKRQRFYYRGFTVKFI